jgi:hypothetical protein
VHDVNAQIELLHFVQTVMACNPSYCSVLSFLFYVASGGGMEALGDGPDGAQKWKVIGGCQQFSSSIVKQLQEDDLTSFHLHCAVREIVFDDVSHTFTVVYENTDNNNKPHQQQNINNSVQRCYNSFAAVLSNEEYNIYSAIAP